LIVVRRSYAASPVGRFSIPDGSCDRPGDARDAVERCIRGVGGDGYPVLARGNADELREARAERAERGTTDRHAHLGDAEIAATQESLRALDAARHEVAVGRLTVRGAEAAGEMAR